MLGIDVSKHQGVIDWPQVKNAGIEFAIIRAGYGREASQKDNYFEDNYSGAKAQGIKVGAYWFNYHVSVEDAKKEAQVFVQAISGKEFDIPVLFNDYEYDSVEYYKKQKGANPSKELVNEMCAAFIEELKGLTGKEVGIYTNLDYINNWFSTDLINKYPLWIASWGSNDGQQHDQPTCSNLVCWQYTSKGSVPGITSSGLDMDIYYGRATETAPVTQTQPIQAQSTASETIYTVVKGDTLSGIAAKYGTTYQILAAYNGIADPNKIYAGQQIKIPSESQAAETPQKTYTVKSGDSLWKIAASQIGSGTKYPEIKSLNGLTSDTIYPGQVLKIPG